MKNIILNNIGLKLLTLILALITWLYLVVEVHKGTTEEREALQRILPYRMVSKQIPIKLDIIGEPQEGYKIEYDKITVKPSSCFLIGPRSLLKRLSSVSTEMIDVSGYSKMFTKDVSIVMPVKGVSVKERFVTVAIPIVKAKE